MSAWILRSMTLARSLEAGARSGEAFAIAPVRFRDRESFIKAGSDRAEDEMHEECLRFGAMLREVQASEDCEIDEVKADDHRDSDSHSAPDPKAINHQGDNE